MEDILADLVNFIGRSMELGTVDEDYGQLEMLDREDGDSYPLAFPAVLVDAPDASWSNLAGRSQTGTVTVRVRLLVDCYDDTHRGSGTTELMACRDALRRRLHALLQGHRICGSSPMSRSASRFYTANHGIKVYESTYTLEVREFLEEPHTVTQAPIVKIKAGIIE